MLNLKKKKNFEKIASKVQEGIMIKSQYFLVLTKFDAS